MKMSAEQLVDILKWQEEMLARIERLERRVRRIEKLEAAKPPRVPTRRALGIVELLQLPDNIRITVWAICKLGGDATADEVAAKTGRTRNIESVYLNQLVRSGHLEKERRGRRVFFKVKHAMKKTVAELVGVGWRL